MDDLAIKAQNLWSSFARKIEPLGNGMELTPAPALDSSDIGGLEGPKDEVATYACAATSPQIYENWGTQPPTGILFLGQRGCGKRLLAEALATQTSTSFLRISVPRLVLDVIHASKKATELVQSWSGFLEEMPRLTVFFDELEFSQAQEIGDRRPDLPVGPIMDFLLEIIDRTIAVEGHLVVAATSHPDSLREAFVVPGRFERLVEVTPRLPDDVVAALQIHARFAEKTRWTDVVRPDRVEAGRVDRARAFDRRLGAHPARGTAPQGTLRGRGRGVRPRDDARPRVRSRTLHAGAASDPEQRRQLRLSTPAARPLRNGRPDPNVNTYIVTGGAGFIGCNFVRAALAQTDTRVVVLDKLTYAGNLENLRDVSSDPRFHFVRADIADRTAVEQVFRDHPPSAILNFAAESHVDRSIDGPEAFIQTNVVGTFVLLEVARHYAARLGASDRDRFRFLHVSTDEVYGSLGATGMFEETTPYAPNSPYSASKAGADHLVRAYHHTYELPTLTTNCSNNYGPYHFPEKMIPLMVLNALEGEPLPIYGDGLNVRDWLYVEDHCEGILAALQRGTPGESYNLGGNNERTNLDIVDGICNELEKLVPAASNEALRAKGVDAYDELKTFVADRPGHDRRYAIDASKARRELGWEPKHDLESGLARTVRWFVDNREWCDTVQQDNYRRERLGLTDDEAS